MGDKVEVDEYGNSKKKVDKFGTTLSNVVNFQNWIEQGSHAQIETLNAGRYMEICLKHKSSKEHCCRQCNGNTLQSLGAAEGSEGRNRRKQTPQEKQEKEKADELRYVSK